MRGSEVISEQMILDLYELANSAVWHLVRDEKGMAIFDRYLLWRQEYEERLVAIYELRSEGESDES